MMRVEEAITTNEQFIKHLKRAITDFQKQNQDVKFTLVEGYSRLVFNFADIQRLCELAELGLSTIPKDELEPTFAAIPRGFADDCSACICNSCIGGGCVDDCSKLSKEHYCPSEKCVVECPFFKGDNF